MMCRFCKASHPRQLRMSQPPYAVELCPTSREATHQGYCIRLIGGFMTVWVSRCLRTRGLTGACMGVHHVMRGWGWLEMAPRKPTCVSMRGSRAPCGRRVGENRMPDRGWVAEGRSPVAQLMKGERFP